MAARARELDVFVYLDYRAYLRDYYESKKASSRGFSFRSFSRRAGLKSPNYLKLVMDGDRNLTASMAERFARACGLDDEASAFFVALVAFNQARSATERNGAYSRLTGFRRYRQAHQLDLQHAAYHSTWYLPAIRELVLRPDFEEDPAWVAKALVPSIAKAEAREALDTLLELGMLSRDEQGRLRQCDALVTTGPETRGLHIGNYHRTMMERAAASIDLVPSSDRDISSLTLCLSEDGLRTVKERIQRFRRELLELSVLEDEPRQVIQVNFQLFPLSRVEVES
ncbi:MAG: TIGR02147 family protein [Myxococcales bacterium]|nr:TIGR02147 family protein [Myxococcales bacterium]